MTVFKGDKTTLTCDDAHHPDPPDPVCGATPADGRAAAPSDG